MHFNLKLIPVKCLPDITLSFEYDGIYDMKFVSPLNLFDLNILFVLSYFLSISERLFVFNTYAKQMKNQIYQVEPKWK